MILDNCHNTIKSKIDQLVNILKEDIHDKVYDDIMINFNLIEDNPNSKLIELDFKNILFLRIHDNKIDFTKTIYFQK